MTEPEHDALVSETIEECAKFAEAIVLAAEVVKPPATLASNVYELGRIAEAKSIAAGLRRMKKEIKG